MLESECSAAYSYLQAGSILRVEHRGLQTHGVLLHPPSCTAGGTDPATTRLQQQEQALLASLHTHPVPKHPAHIIDVLHGGHLCPWLLPLPTANNCCSSSYIFLCNNTTPRISAWPSKHKVCCTLSFICIVLHLN